MTKTFANNTTDIKTILNEYYERRYNIVYDISYLYRGNLNSRIEALTEEYIDKIFQMYLKFKNKKNG